MSTHEELLDRIEEIKEFFHCLGLIKKHDFPKNWNLDSNIKYEPRDFNFIIHYKGQNRILISIDINIMSGLIFTFSGAYKPELAVYEQIHTDYFFKHKYNDFIFFKNEYRDFKLNKIMSYEN